MTKVRLLTLCGCSKITEADDDLGLPIAIKVPMRVRMPVNHMPTTQELMTRSVHVRTFRFEQVTDLPEYVEILDERLKL
jgi:hypothetical protein